MDEPAVEEVVVSVRTGPAFTPEITSRIISRVTDGALFVDAARAQGVSRSALWRWRSRGQAAAEREEAGEEVAPEDEPYLAFVREIEDARAKAKVEAISIVRRAALGQKVTKTTTIEREVVIRGEVRTIKTTTTEEKVEYAWTAAAWYLERQYPAEFGRRDRMEVSGPDGGAIPIEERVRSIAAEAETFLREREAEEAAGEGQSAEGS